MLASGSTSLHKSSMNRNNVVRLITALAWVAIIAIAYATLTKVGFVYAIYFKLAPFLMQPEMGTYAHLEHVVAFAILGTLFSFAYPRRTILVCCIVLGAAAFLEIAQTLTPDRHGTLMDALEKVAGGATGILFARTIQHFCMNKPTTSD
ncbi:VanZ like family protein [Bradyrhizobium erythrophlei]|nr:VanZ like family protein [Bradyrhizobium erythrophlei]